MFGLTVPKYCIVLLHHLLNNAGDNKNFVHVLFLSHIFEPLK